MPIGPESSQPEPESFFRVKLGRAARALVKASQTATTQAVTELGPDIVSLTDLRHEPNRVDPNSPQYRAGASDALAIVSQELLGYLLHPSEVEKLRSDGVATTLAAIAAQPGIGLDGLNRYHDADKAKNHLKTLENMMLAEPARPLYEAQGWQLTPQGKSAFIRLLPHHLASVLTEHEIAEAVVGIVRSYEDETPSQ
jgi:hypothetical protein